MNEDESEKMKYNSILSYTKFFKNRKEVNIKMQKQQIDKYQNVKLKHVQARIHNEVYDILKNNNLFYNFDDFIEDAIKEKLERLGIINNED